MALHSEATLDRRFVEFAKLLNTYLNHFPRHEKYGLAHELGYFAFRDGERCTPSEDKADHRYLVLSRHIDELGRMIGGWITAERDKAAGKEQQKAARESS